MAAPRLMVDSNNPRAAPSNRSLGSPTSSGTRASRLVSISNPPIQKITPKM